MASQSIRSILSRLPKNARGVALGIVMKLEAGQTDFDDVWHDDPAFLSLQPRDRRLTYFIASGMLKHRKTLEHIARTFTGRKWDHTHPTVKQVIRQAIFQMQFADRIPEHAAVFAAVEMAKRLGHARAAGLVNGVLRNFLRNPGRVYFPNRESDPVDHLALVHSYPEWLVRLIVERHGIEETEKWLIWGNAPPRLHVRINSLKANVEKVRDILSEHGAEIPSPPANFPSSLEVVSSVLVRDHPMLAQGLAWVQSPASYLVVELLDPQLGDTVLDLFAAPGGKSFDAALRVGHEGQVLSVDKNPQRLAMLSENRDRLGLSNVLPFQGDVSGLKPHMANRVLADCPCSALGTLAKSAEVRWTKLPADVERLAQSQKEWLAAASKHVKPGGVLVYSVCTITDQETYGVVDVFLASHPEFAMEPAPAHIPREFIDDRGFVRTIPPRDGFEGIFAARFRRISN